LRFSNTAYIGNKVNASLRQWKKKY
jgi:hypothetical protein